MLHNTARNINLAPLTFWSNNWGVLYIDDGDLSKGTLKLTLFNFEKWALILDCIYFK